MRWTVGLWLLPTTLGAVLTWELASAPISGPPIPAAGVSSETPVISSRHEISAAFSAREDAAYEQIILARPLFAPSRRPPAAAAAATAQSSVRTLPRLTGVIITPGTRLALFASTEGKVITAAMGVMVGGYVVSSIAPDEAILLGPHGARQVHISFPHVTRGATSYEIDAAQDAPGQY
jgi:hypothetical protein